MGTRIRTFSARESALIVYRASQYQDDTWWMRSLRLTRVSAETDPAPPILDLRQLQEVGAAVGLNPDLIRRAAESLSDCDDWRSSTT